MWRVGTVMCVVVGRVICVMGMQGADVCGGGQGDLCDGYARCRCVWRWVGCKSHPTSNPSLHSQRESKCTTYMYKYIPHHLSRSKVQTSSSEQDWDERYAEGERGQLRWEGAALGVDGKEEWRSYHQIIISSSINAHQNLVHVPSNAMSPSMIRFNIDKTNIFSASKQQMVDGIIDSKQ